MLGKPPFFKKIVEVGLVKVDVVDARIKNVLGSKLPMYVKWFRIKDLENICWVKTRVHGFVKAHVGRREAFLKALEAWI